MESRPLTDHILNFDIDRYINPWLPHNRLNALPRPISHFLGARKGPQKDPPTLVIWILMFVSTVAGLALVGGVYNFGPGLTKYNPPVMVASLGASAVLDYNAIKSPLAQPRNAVLGHGLSAIIGVCISKLFQLNDPFFADYSWVAAAVACACASWVMSVTNTIHPPGGATAILACTDTRSVAMGWMFVPLLLVGNLLMLGVALLFNNLLRQYPVFWWTPQDVGQKLHRQEEELDKKEPQDEGEAEKQASQEESDSDEHTLRQELSGNIEFTETEDMLITPYKIRLPGHVHLSDEEVGVLSKLQQRAEKHNVIGG